jgi:hypothetical protein
MTFFWRQTVQQPSGSAYADPLDVLRRFVPAPLKAVYRIGSHRVTVQTNDIALFPAFPLETGTLVRGDKDVEWKLIRDLDVPGLLAPPVLLNCGVLTIVEMGTACFLAFDRERRELLGFIGADVDARTHQEFLVPFLCRMTNEELPPPSTNETFGLRTPGPAND